MPNDINKLRRIMRQANHLRNEKSVILRGAETTSSQALKYAWWFEHFREQLRSGVYRFSYIKKDGSIREARGTLNFALIPEDKRPKGDSDREDNTDKGTFTYYDLDAAGWRSFRLDNFIGFVEQVSA